MDSDKTTAARDGGARLCDETIGDAPSHGLPMSGSCALGARGNAPAPHNRLPEEDAVLPHLTMIIADRRIADMHRCAGRSRRARDVAGQPKRRFGLLRSHPLLLPGAQPDLSPAR